METETTIKLKGTEKQIEKLLMSLDWFIQQGDLKDYEVL